jgi:outer membrane immunogenic protein
VKLRTHTATLGIAYRFGGVDPPAYTAAGPDAPVYKAPPAALAPSWTGFYVGFDGGVRSTRTDVTTTSALDDGTPFDLRFDATSAPFDGSAFRFGPFVGYNLQIAPQWLLGIEGDFGWARQTTALIGIPFTPGFMPAGNPHDSLAIKTTWDAGARGRLGYLVTPSFLVYVTGGAAWLHYETTSSCGPTGCLLFLLPAVITNSTTKTGWTIGTGIETMLWGNWFARGEYRYADFGTGSFTLSRTGAPPDAGLTNYDVRVRTHTALFGIAYKFGNVGAVIAKY